MPLFNSGNQAWDQGLNNFSGGLESLFDPRGAAMAGYYGAEARNAQLQGNKVQTQMGAEAQLGDLVAGLNTAPPPAAAPPPPAASAPPPPAASAPPPPVAAPPPAASQAPPAAAPPPAPPAPPGAPQAGAPVGANLPPGALATLFSQGGGAVPQVDPSQIADKIATVATTAPNLTQGQAPPASSPAPGSGAPPAPNTTTSDGNPPANDATSGVLHPGSVTPPGGGQKQAGPAAPDGSPAPMPPALSNIIAKASLLATRAGYDAARTSVVVRGIIESMYDSGQIHDDLYHHLMGNQDPSIINQDTVSRTQIQTTGMTVAGENQRQGMVTGEQKREFDQGIVQIVNPADPNGPPLAIKRQDYKPGMMEWNQGVATQRGGPVLVNKPDGSGQVNVPLSTAMTPGPNQPTAYTPGTADINQQQRGTVGTYVDPKHPERGPFTANAGQATDNGYVPYGTGVPKPMTAEETYKQQTVDYINDQRAFPGSQADAVNFKITAPIAFTPEAQSAVDSEALRLQSTNIRYQNNPTLAHQDAVRNLQNQGVLPNAAAIVNLRKGIRSSLYGVGDTRVGAYQAPGSNKAADHLMVGLVKPGGQPEQQTQPQQNQPAQTAPPVAAQPPASSVFAPPASGRSQPYASPTQIYGSGGGPSPTPGSGRPVPPFLQGIRPNAANSTPLSPAQLFGGVAAPPAPTAPAPAAPAIAQGRPVMAAPPGVGEGQTVYQKGVPVGVVHGGQVYAMPPGGTPMAASGP